MSDGQPPKRSFEPPPWEKEQFEELARKRAEEQRADAALDELLAPPPQPEPEPEHDPEQEQEREAVARTVAPEAPAPPADLDEKRIAAMLVQLSGQEPPALHSMKRASRVVAVAVMFVGAAIVLIGALVGLRSAAGSQLGAMSALVGGLIGVAIVAVGAWLWIRAKK